MLVVLTFFFLLITLVFVYFSEDTLNGSNVDFWVKIIKLQKKKYRMHASCFQNDHMKEKGNLHKQKPNKS